MIDTHTHLYLEEFADDSAAAVQRAIDAGVDKMVFPNVGIDTLRPMKSLHRLFADASRMAIGLHPTEMAANWKDVLSEVEKEIPAEKWVAIGEVGIDLYWDKTFRDAQMEAFDIQLGWAERLMLPVIIHCREGLDETLEVIAGHHDLLERRLVFHSFTGSWKDVERIRKIADPYFGINGVATFKNAQSVRDAIPAVTLERILLETDSPYLAPVPYRGRRNESCYLPAICAKVAEVLSVEPAKVECATDAAAMPLFGFVSND